MADAANRWQCLIAALWLGIAGSAMFNLSPIFLASLSDAFQLTNRQIGLLAGIEIGGFAVASFSAPYWIFKLGYRKAAFTGVSSLIVGNLLSLLASNPTELVIARLLTGLCGDGPTYITAILILGARLDPTRAFGMLTFSNMCFTGIALMLLPLVLVQSSWIALPCFLAMLGGAGLFAVRWLPVHLVAAAAGRVRTTTTPSWCGFAALAGIFFFCIDLGAIWAFAERIGQSIGLDLQSVGFYLGLSMPFQALGSLLAAVIGTTYGRVIPLLAALLGQMLALMLLWDGGSEWLFFTAIALWGCSWNFGFNYQLGQLADLPDGKHWLVLAPGGQATGIALGPSFTGLLLIGNDYHQIILLAGACVLLGLGLALAVSKLQRNLS
ncbi:MAG: MFS transporter [Candidatus Competibacteraceae bacterium]|jgi:MFS family permease|nr:MFS transporter [Candidatus Competibacteraceae bacterium]